MKYFKRSFLIVMLVLPFMHCSSGSFIKPGKLIKSLFDAYKGGHSSTEHVVFEEDVPIYEVPAQVDYQIVEEKPIAEPIVEPVVQEVIFDKPNNFNSASASITHDLASKSQSMVDKVKNTVATAKDEISEKISAITSKFHKSSPVNNVHSAIELPATAPIVQSEPIAPETKLYFYPMPYQLWPNYAPPAPHQQSIVQSTWIEPGIRYPLKSGDYLNSLAGLSIKNGGQWLSKVPCKTNALKKIEPIKYQPYAPYYNAVVTKTSGASLPIDNNLWTQYIQNGDKPILNNAYENVNHNPHSLGPVTFDKQQEDNGSAIQFRGDIPAFYESLSGPKQPAVVILPDSSDKSGQNEIIIPVSEQSEILSSLDVK